MLFSRHPQTREVEEEHHMKRRSSGANRGLSRIRMRNMGSFCRRRKMKQPFLLGVFGIMALVGAEVAPATDKTKSEETFDRLASLTGEWKGEQSGVEIKVIYTLTADGSAL